MCRNIKILFNFDPPATDEEIRDASLQFVRKISGMNKPSSANDGVFEHAADEINRSTRKLLDSLVTSSKLRDREIEARKAHAKTIKRFGV